MLSAARGLDLRAPLAPARATAAVRDAVREHADGPGPDRYLSPEIEAVTGAVLDGSLVAAAESVTGPLS